MPETPRHPRPMLVMVTGEPGSGKTSLGVLLSGALRVPFLSRDHVRGGLLATAGLWTGRLDDPPAREAAVDAFVEVVETAARLGVTLVLEFIVTPQRIDAFRRLQAVARVVVVLVESVDARARADHRDRADPLINRPQVLGALGLSSIEGYVAGAERTAIAAAMQRELGLPTLRVRTDDGYDPPLEQIVDWVVGASQAGRVEGP